MMLRLLGILCGRPRAKNPAWWFAHTFARPASLAAGGEECGIEADSNVICCSAVDSGGQSDCFTPSGGVPASIGRGRRASAVVRVVDENNDPVVGSSLFSTVLMDSPAASEGQIDTQKNGTELGAPQPAGMPNQKKAEPGGKTMSTLIIAALIAGGVIALILLLRGGDDHKTVTAGSRGVTSPPQDVGTILVPGTPSVSTPH